MKEKPVWGYEVVNERLTVAFKTYCSGRTVAAFGFPVLSQQYRGTPLMHADLPKQDATNSALQGLQLMTND